MDLVDCKWNLLTKFTLIPLTIKSVFIEIALRYFTVAMLHNLHFYTKISAVQSLNQVRKPGFIYLKKKPLASDALTGTHGSRFFIMSFKIFAESFTFVYVQILVHIHRF
ncbi:hypothetical protein L873DRAFT_707056 [Choiromyces venosus 120613-1]|uniref:Uncharacterized protein n=1 Tax=Choiromyces venosus 120613-1 TaxID=1336337 RepID=A0A3N4IXX6_9PEZI|nr:hypothetical protein L873DRAFT_707056 [Choiromyces venosus 120613-1]